MKKIEKIICVTMLALGLIFSSLSYAETVWVDVRTVAENNQDSIEGDLLISHLTIVEGISKLYPDNNTDIRLYCRSGNRAGQAVTALKQAGYTNVHNMGSIGATRQARGLTK